MTGRTPLLRAALAALLTLATLTPARAALVASWNFDEGSGSTADDSAGSYDGTLQGATWASDRFGQTGKALQFAVNQWMDVSDSLKPAQLTVASWIYIDAFESDACPIISAEKGFGATGFSLRFGLMADHHLMLETIAPVGESSSRYATSSDVLVTGQWYHVAGTYDGQTVAVYVDGTLAGSTTYGTAQNINTAGDIPVGIGHLQGWSVQWFRGKMDDLQVYDNALTSGEVAALVPEPSSTVLVAFAALLGLRRSRFRK